MQSCEEQNQSINFTLSMKRCDFQKTTEKTYIFFENKKLFEFQFCEWDKFCNAYKCFDQLVCLALIGYRNVWIQVLFTMERPCAIDRCAYKATI